MAESGFRFISGDDEYLLLQRGQAWYEEQTRDVEDDLSKDIIDGRAGNVAEVEQVIAQFTSAVQTLPMFGGPKVVWLRGISFLADNQTGRAQGTQDALESMKACLEHVDPSSARVLLTAAPVDRRRTFYKWLTSHGAGEHLSMGKEGGAVLLHLIQEECEAAGVKITRDAGEILIGKVNGHSRMVVEEIRKLITYIGKSGDPITADLVIELVPNYGEGDFFEATETFFTFDLRATLASLDRHFFTQGESRPLVASLQGRTRLLIQLRALVDAGEVQLGGRGLSKADLEKAARRYGNFFGEEQEKSNLNVFTQHPYYLSRLGGAAAKVSLRRLLDIQLALGEVFEEIVARPNEQHLVLREFAIRALS